MNNKVLFVNLRLTAGGSERVMSLLANGFSERGIETEMLILKNEEKTYHINDDVKLTECFCPHSGNKLVWHIKRILSIRKAIIASEANTVISFMWDVNMHVILACVGLKKKVVISERADPRNEKRQKAFQFAKSWIFPLADLTVFQTEDVKACYAKANQTKSAVIPNPVNIPESRIELKNSEPIVLAVGRCVEQKNFTMLLDAFNSFYMMHKNYKLLILGEGPEKERLIEYTAKLDCANNVCFVGFVKNVSSYMQRCAIYASSSNYEGISNSMLEALALGLPTICTDCPVGGAAMMIKNNINGILVPLNNKEAMAEALAQIADNPRFAEELSLNAYRMSKNYSISKIVDMWLKEIGIDTKKECMLYEL